jgi:hypothetical protein
MNYRQLAQRTHMSIDTGLTILIRTHTIMKREADKLSGCPAA